MLYLYGFVRGVKMQITESTHYKSNHKPIYGKFAISRHYLKMQFCRLGKIGVETHRKPFRRLSDQSEHIYISRFGGVLKMGFLRINNTKGARTK